MSPSACAIRGAEHRAWVGTTTRDDQSYCNVLNHSSCRSGGGARACRSCLMSEGFCASVSIRSVLPAFALARRPHPPPLEADAPNGDSGFPRDIEGRTGEVKKTAHAAARELPSAERVCDESDRAERPGRGRSAR